MTASVIVWICVAAFLLVVILMRIADEKRTTSRHHAKHHSQKFKFLELGKEREEFFIAGDRPISAPLEDYDDIDD